MCHRAGTVQLGVARQVGAAAARFVRHQCDPAAGDDLRVVGVEVQRSGVECEVAPVPVGAAGVDELRDVGVGVAEQVGVRGVVTEQCGTLAQRMYFRTQRSGCHRREGTTQRVRPAQPCAAVGNVGLDGRQHAHVPALAAGVAGALEADDEDGVACRQTGGDALQPQLGVAAARLPGFGGARRHGVPFGAGADGGEGLEGLRGFALAGHALHAGAGRNDGLCGCRSRRGLQREGQRRAGCDPWGEAIADQACQLAHRQALGGGAQVVLLCEAFGVEGQHVQRTRQCVGQRQAGVAGFARA